MKRVARPAPWIHRYILMSRKKKDAWLVIIYGRDESVLSVELLDEQSVLSLTLDNGVSLDGRGELDSNQQLRSDSSVSSPIWTIPAKYSVIIGQQATLLQHRTETKLSVPLKSFTQPNLDRN